MKLDVNKAAATESDQGLSREYAEVAESALCTIASFYRSSRSASERLRVGLLLDSTELPSCFAEVVDQILESNFANLELIVINEESRVQAPSALPPRSKVRKLVDLMRNRQLRRAFLFELYQRWDRRHVTGPEDPRAPVDCSERLKHVETLAVMPLRKRFVHRFPPEALDSIREKRLDVLLRFGFNILRGDILTAARYGVWSYHHGDGDSYRGGPPHFWEVREGNSLSGVMLQVLTEELDAGKVLCKGLFATYPGISQVRNHVQPYWGGSTYIIQKLHELHEEGWERLAQNILPPASYQGKKKIYTAPTNLEMVQWLGPVLVKKSVRRILRRPAAKHWRLAIRTGDRTIVTPGQEPDLNGFRWIESPLGRYYADPFMVNESGKTWIFFEDYDYGTKRGGISCAEVLTDGAGIGPVRPVLRPPYHLSYPCIFRSGAELYMIPESVENESIELYRCTGFPDRWELQKTLLRARAVDTSVWVNDEGCWFFVTFQESRGMGSQLRLFHSRSISGKWTLHPANPISMDVRNNRGGGAIFRRGDKLFRPSQDCSKQYGYSFTLNEILRLERGRYEERPSVTVNPVWSSGLIGTHTFSHDGRIEVIDGCVRLPAAKVAGRIPAER